MCVFSGLRVATYPGTFRCWFRVMEYWRCCVKDVFDQAENKQGRVLSSATMQTALQTLKDFVSKLQADEKLDDIEDGFLCRSC